MRGESLPMENTLTDDPSLPSTSDDVKSEDVDKVSLLAAKKVEAANLIPNIKSSIPDVTGSVPDINPDIKSSIPVITSSIRDTAPSIPDTAPSIPDIAAPSIPDTEPSVPDTEPSIPDLTSSIPDPASSIPDVTGSVSVDGNNKENDNGQLQENDIFEGPSDGFEICRPCSVVLKKLTPEEISVHTAPQPSHSIGFEQESRYLRQFESVGDSSAFNEFRKTRNEFLKRKGRPLPDTYYGFFSGDEFSFPSDEDSFMGNEEEEKKKRKRKKHNYEDDTEWSPPCDYKGLIKPRHKKTSKSLRVNTRRKRIESASSDSSDEEQHKNPYGTRTKHKPSGDPLSNDAMCNEVVAAVCPPAKKKKKASAANSEPKARVEDPPLNPANNDLVSQILQEMANYAKSGAKNGASEVRVGEGSMNFPYTHAKRAYQKKKRVSRVVRATSGNASDHKVVKKLVNDMVNSVCSIEGRKRSYLASTGAVDEEGKMKCKWCDTPLPSSNPSEILCVICRDMGRNVKAFSNKPKKSKPTGVRANTKASPTRSKMINRVFKNLPKYEKQKIMYNSQVNASSVEKGYNHCKSLFDSKDLKDSVSGGEGAVNPTVKKKRKVKSKADGTPPAKMTKKRKNLPINENLGGEGLKKMSEVQKRAAQALKNAAGSNQTQVSLTGIDKGLFLMTFPEPHHGLDTPKSSGDRSVQPRPKDVSNKHKQPVAKNVQYGTYLLPPVPTVVVANYAATDAKSGDYYLSSLYYQNEMTQSKNAALKNGSSQSNIPSLPSMPSMEQLSDENNALALPQTYQFNDAQPHAADDVRSLNDTLTDVLQPSMCSGDSNLSNLLNNPHLQIDAVPIENFEPDASVEKLLRNSQLQIEPLPFSMPEIAPNDSLQNELLSGDGKESPEIDDQRGALGLSEQETGPLGANVNPLIGSDASKTNENEVKDASKPASDSNARTSAPEEATSKTAPSQYEGMDLLKNSCAELDAICIMSVVDLDENPKNSLSRYVISNKNDLEKLKNSDAQNEHSQQKIKTLADNTHVLDIAQNYMRTYGSFGKLSDSLLRRAKLLEIKKECIEQETMSSCQFANKKAPEPPCKEAPVNAETSLHKAVRIKMENASSCAEDFISKIQNQVDNMQNVNSMAERTTPLGGIIHHFPGLNPGMVTAMPAAPRSDLLNESRETPSRGSGPRTPARPESAMSQADDQPLTALQIKKERMEAAASPMSQCAYSQNAASPHITAPSPIVYPQSIPPLPQHPIASSDMSRLTMTVNMPPHMSSGNPPQVQNYVHFQNAAPPNVTVPFSNTPTFQKVLVNVAQKQQQQQQAQRLASMNANQNTNVIIKNGQLYNLQQVQQVYLPRGPPQPRIEPQTTTSLVNMNQLVFKQAAGMSTSAGTMVVSGGEQSIYQNRYANVPVSQPSSQICSSLPQNLPGNAVNPPSTGFLMHQNNKQISGGDNVQNMLCAVCNKVATLRCRQCAKVAYCDTVCAKTYWHAKHKMECQPIS